MSINCRDYPPMPGGKDWPNVPRKGNTFPGKPRKEILRRIEELALIGDHKLTMARDHVKRGEYDKAISYIHGYIKVNNETADILRLMGDK